MNQRELAHQWAHQNITSGEASALSVDGPRLRSYATTIGQHGSFSGKPFVVLNTRSFSSTTSKHQSYMRVAACSPFEVNVSEPRGTYDLCPTHEDSIPEWARAVVDDHLDHASDKGAEMLRPRIRQTTRDRLEEEGNALLVKARDIAEFFETGQSVEIDEDRVRQLAEARAKRQREEAERMLRMCADAIEEWKRGERVNIPPQVKRVFLRLRKILTDGVYCPLVLMVETSLGVHVPVEDAHRTYRFAQAYRKRGWKRNGEQHKIGDFQLDAVNDHGIVAGCHRIDWEEIERFALSMGWAK